MIAKRIATLLAAVAVTAASPAFAQSAAPAAPVPARENSVRGSAQMEGWPVAAYVVAAVVLGGLVYGLVKFVDDDDGDNDDLPVSP